MDTSEKYIKMCEKAQEIQSKREFGEWGNNFEDNDFFYGFETSGDCDNIIFKSMPDFDDTNVKVWLPRQDQLQEIVMSEFDEDYWLQDMLGSFESYTDHIELDNTTLTFEQLWLTFVMREKFNKVWSEEKQEWTLDS